MMGFEIRGLYLLIVLVAAVGMLSGCAGTYQPQVFIGSKFNSNYVEDVAKSSTDVFGFVSKIYNKHNRIGERDVISNREFIFQGGVNYDNLWNTYIFETYCKAKLGQYYKLGTPSGSTRYYICEVNDKMESVLGYFEYRDSTGPVYSVQAMTPSFFTSNIQYNHNEYYYTNDDKSIRLDSYSYSYPNKFRLIFKFKNKGSSPLHFALNNAKVILDGKEYLVDLKYKNGITINPDEALNSYETLTINGHREFVSDNVVLILGDTKYVLKKRMTYADKEPFLAKGD